MSFSRKKYRPGKRSRHHDYYSRCIYHIVLNKREGIPVFSNVRGIVGDHHYPPHVELTPLGEKIASAISKIKERYPFVTIPRRCIMPDHVHVAIFVHEKTDTHLGRIISHVKRTASELAEKIGWSPDTYFFEESYHDTILRGKGQLARMLGYISDNPRRHLVRRQLPGWFHHFRITDGTDTLEAYGNWDLLYEPDMAAVKISRTFTNEELIRRKRHWLETIENEGVLVSPFISDAEKRVRDWTMDNNGSLILITAEQFGEKYKPQGKLFEACSEGRLLIISTPEYIGGEPSKNPHPSRQHCLKMNELAERIASGLFAPCR